MKKWYLFYSQDGDSLQRLLREFPEKKLARPVREIQQTVEKLARPVAEMHQVGTVFPRLFALVSSAQSCEAEC